ncbi:MAG: hypothetical protein KAI79_20185 [Bacteroidales bacterium]|nr:hypothetical protein [Bacteroidales bacterium]
MLLESQQLEMLKQLGIADPRKLGGRERYFYILDNAGGIRWLFSENLKKPTFLALYNTNTLKGKIYKVLIHMAFLSHLQKYFVSGSIEFSLHEKILLLLKKLNIASFSIFTGTAGENRKVVIEANNTRSTLFFIKVPVTKSAKKLIKTESLNLESISHLDMKKTIVPTVSYFDEEYLAITNIKPKMKVIDKVGLIDIHFESFFEIYSKTVKTIVFTETEYFKESQKYIEVLDSTVENDIDPLLVKKIHTNLKLLSKSITSAQVINVSLSHCDFTPWNMYVTKTKLFVYDWEMGRNDAPLLFDFFHYIFQTEVLVTHHNYSEIKKEINKLLENKILKEILSEYKIDFNTYYSLYLMYNVSYYVSLYIKQKDLHIQAHWLIDVWNDALEDFIQNEGKVFDK